jgi:hypothetical protein
VQGTQSFIMYVVYVVIYLVLICCGVFCKGNLTDLRRILHLSLAKGNPKYIYKSGRDNTQHLPSQGKSKVNI